MKNNNNKVYIAGDMLTKGSTMLREKEREEIKDLGLDFYNPMDNKDINDKANLDNNDGLAEKIVRADTNAIKSSNIMIAEVQPFAIGTLMEVGQMKGMKDVAKMIQSEINSAKNAEMAISGIMDIVNHIINIKVYPHLQDVRRFKGCTESEDRRAWGINQYCYGVCLDLTDGVGLYEWDEILDELNKIKEEDAVEC